MADTNQFMQRFVRHVPKVLVEQMLAHLIRQFLYKNGGEEYSQIPSAGENASLSSISRFHGALLFVDISGFTVLSQRLPVDELRVHINAYFKKILDLIYNHGGDVIKFAGDALYAVWRVVPMHQTPSQALTRAAHCGVEINIFCSDHRINFNERDRGTSQLSTILLNIHEEEYLVAPEDGADHTFLNVHAGLSYGAMAGIDVGAADRWEYLIIGPPLAEVAAAESEATKGELVISPAAHELLCGHCAEPTDPATEPTVCDCTLTPGGSYKVNTSNARHRKAQRPEVPEEEKDDMDYEFEIHELVMVDACQAFESTKNTVMKIFKAMKDQQVLSKGEQQLQQTQHSLTSGKFGDVSDEEGEIVFGFFLQWMESCITDDLWRHVHEATRMEFVPENAARTDCLAVLTKPEDHSSRHTSHSDSSSRHGSLSESRHRRSLGSDASSGSGSFVQRMRSLGSGSSSSSVGNSLKQKQQARHERTLQKDSSLTGELRNVIVLFINIMSDEGGLLQEPEGDGITRSAGTCNAFSFLPTTESERSADLKLLAHYQKCMEIIVTALKSKGGQMRQFIVDDKGTVSIGTFGLRGSVNPDNAAAAVEAAQIIISDLAEHGIGAGIGITSGKAYCGLVGSLRRHEFAVMGPSTNLSARLMASAKAGHIICDVNIRKSDRTHQYRALGEVKAKGYAAPVPTFRPHFMRGSVVSNDGQLATISRQLSRDSGGLSRQQTFGGKKRKAMIIGRDDEERRLLIFLLRPMITEGSPVEEFLHSLEARNEPTCMLRAMETTTVALRTDFDTRLSIIEGPSGIGKSALLDSLCEKVTHFTVKNAINAVLVRGTSSSFNIDPFRSWKSVLRTMLGIFADLHTENVSGEPSEEQKGPDSKHAQRARWQRGLAYVATLLSAEQVSMLPLLASAHLLKVEGLGDVKACEALSGAQKMTKLAALLYDLLCLLPKHANKVVFLVFDDAQFLDPASWTLLQQLWQQGQGFVVLLSFAGKVGQDECGPLTQSLAKTSDGFVECDRVHRIVLAPLESNAVMELVEGIFGAEGYTIEDNSVYERMLSISGGNPLYIYELCRAIVDKASTTKRQRQSILSRSDFGALLKDFHTARVEEVIFYRFDQLTAQCQMILKMAAIACSGGSAFTVAMLQAMLADRDQLDALKVFGDDGSSRMIIKEISAILEKDEFLKISQSSRRNSMADSQLEPNLSSLSRDLLEDFEDDGDDSTGLEHACFDFKIVLERETIYGLMLEDQRESLHDRVAAFLETENTFKDRETAITSADLYEEGFHWEKAAVWGSAMTCYYRSAIKLDALGAFEEAFQRLAAAYRMLTALRKEAGILEDLETPRQFTLQDVIGELKVAIDNNSIDAWDAPKIFNWSREDLSRVFGADSALLDVGLNVSLRLAQSSFTLTTNATITSRLYEDALLMIMLTWSYECAIDPAQPITSTVGYFGLQEPQVVFPILSGIATMFRTHRLADDSQQTNEATMYRLIMTMAESSPDYAIHRMQGMCLLHSLHSESFNFTLCSELAASVGGMYATEEHSPQLVKWYGNDRVPYTLARDATLQKLRGDFCASDKAIKVLLGMLPKLKHLHSLGILALPLSGVLTAIGRVSEAQEVYEFYYNTEQMRDGYSFFRDINPLYVEYLKTVLAEDSPLAVGEMSSLQTRVVGREFLHVTGRPLLYDAVNSMTVGVEFVCAELLKALSTRWLLFAATLEGAEQPEALRKIRDLLLVAQEYATLSASATADTNRSVFSHAMGLLSQASTAHCLKLVCLRINDADTQQVVAAYETTARGALEALISIGTKNKLPFLTLWAAIYTERMGLAMDHLQLQQQAMIAILAVNTDCSVEEVSAELLRLFPALERSSVWWNLRREEGEEVPVV